MSKVTPGGGVSTFATGSNNPFAVAFDAAGNLYVANLGAGTVSEVSTRVTVPFTLGGTATAGVDYSGVTASPLVFAPGQTTVDITGTLLPDPGGVQTITFTLGTPSSNAVLGSPAANTLTIVEPNPAPTLTSISPTSATADSASTTITLTGTGFINGSTADFNGTPITTTFDSATTLTAVVPVTDLTTAGTDSITVVTGSPGGGTSAAQTFTVFGLLTQAHDAGVTVAPGGTDVIVTGFLQYTETEAATSQLTYTVNTLPSAGKLLLNNVALAVGGTFTQANIDAGLLSYQNTVPTGPPATPSPSPSATATARAVDSRRSP